MLNEESLNTVMNVVFIAIPCVLFIILIYKLRKEGKLNLFKRNLEYGPDSFPKVDISAMNREEIFQLRREGNLSKKDERRMYERMKKLGIA